MKKIYLIYLLTLLSCPVFAQSEFTEEFFGEGIGFTEGFNSIQTSDRGFLLIGGKGYQDLSNAQNPWIIKLDQEGEHQWETEVDFAGEGWWDFGIDAAEVADGYVILGNYNDPTDFNTYSSLIKLDFDGNFIWKETIGPDGEFGSIASSGGSNFIIGGSYNFEMSLIKFSSDGDMIWSQSYTLPNASLPFYAFAYMGDVAVASDGGLLFTLRSDSSASLIKTDQDGDILWLTEMQGANGMSVKELGNGELLVLTSEYSDGDFIVEDFLVHLDSLGNIIDESLISDQIMENVRDMTVDAEGNVYLSGMNTSLAAIVAKTNLAGDTLWTKTFEHADGSGLTGLSFDGIILTDDGELGITGAGWGPILSGNASTPALLYFVKMSLDGFVSSVIYGDIIQEKLFDVFPLPATDHVNLISKNRNMTSGQVQLFNLSGRLVKTSAYDHGRIELYRDGLPAGTYLFVAHSDAGISSGKIIFE